MTTNLLQFIAFQTAAAADSTVLLMKMLFPRELECCRLTDDEVKAQKQFLL